MVSESELIGRLREFLRSSDLNTTTTATVRRQLEADFGIDLSDRKAFIREQVDLFLQTEHNQSQQEEEEKEEKHQNDHVEEQEEDAPNNPEQSQPSDSKEVTDEDEEEEDEEEEEDKPKHAKKAKKNKGRLVSFPFSLSIENKHLRFFSFQFFWFFELDWRLLRA